MASSWRYPQRSDEDRQLTSFRLPMCNHPPISPSSPPHSLTALPTKTKKRQRGGPRGEMVGRQVSEVIPKMETSHSLVALPQLKGGEEKSDRGWERHDSKGDYCKVGSHILRIAFQASPSFPQQQSVFVSAWRNFVVFSPHGTANNLCWREYTFGCESTH